jgi:hypothetical protein
VPHIEDSEILAEGTTDGGAPLTERS